MKPSQMILASAAEQEVYDYWRQKVSARPRSETLKQAHLRRIRNRLKEGYSVEELKKAVDVACFDEFYVAHGYYRQPEVIFRNETRIDTLLLKWEREASRPVPL